MQAVYSKARAQVWNQTVFEGPSSHETLISGKRRAPLVPSLEVFSRRRFRVKHQHTLERLSTTLLQNERRECTHEEIAFYSP